jgi:hypothetical protein
MANEAMACSTSMRTPCRGWRKYNAMVETLATPIRNAHGSDLPRRLLMRRASSTPRMVAAGPATGRRTAAWRRETFRTREPSSADPSGTYGIGGLAVNPDGKSYVYNLGRTLSDLYLVGGTEVETGRNRVASALVGPSGIGMRRRGRQRPVDAATAMSDKVLREIQPSSENCGMYAGLLGVYRGLYPGLRGPIARLAGRTKG